MESTFSRFSSQPYWQSKIQPTSWQGDRPSLPSYYQLLQSGGTRDTNPSELNPLG